MVDFSRIEKISDSLSKYKVEPVEGKKDKTGKPKEFPSDRNKQHNALLYGLLKTIIKLLPKKKEEAYFKSLLKTFGQTLLALTYKDLSRNPEYLRRLSSSWNHFFELYSPLVKPKKEYRLLSHLVKMIHDYPYTQKYPLGYYLSECSEKLWLPVPFMDIIHSLYDEHQKDPSNSTLSKWLSLIHVIIEKE